MLFVSSPVSTAFSIWSADTAGINIKPGTATANIQHQCTGCIATRRWFIAWHAFIMCNASRACSRINTRAWMLPDYLAETKRSQRNQQGILNRRELSVFFARPASLRVSISHSPSIARRRWIYASPGGQTARHRKADKAGIPIQGTARIPADIHAARFKSALRMLLLSTVFRKSRTATMNIQAGRGAEITNFR